jgi:hypothetical protein
LQIEFRKACESPEDSLLQVAQLIAVQSEVSKAREVPEDRRGQVAQQIVVQIEAPKVCETIEDSLGHVDQLIAGQIEGLAGTHAVENAISQFLDTLVVEVQNSRVFGTRAGAVQDAAGVCGKAAGPEGARQTSFRTTFGTMRCEDQGEKRHNQERWLRQSAPPVKAPLQRGTY